MIAVVADDAASADAPGAAPSAAPASVARAPSPFAPCRPGRAARSPPWRASASALDLIAAGDLFEVNLARRLVFAFDGDPQALFASLLVRAPAPWAFFQDLGHVVVCGTSPELALSVRGDVLRTCPIKGTRPRGHDAADDAHAGPRSTRT